MTGQEYRIGTRNLRRADLNMIGERVRYWKDEVYRLERRSRIRVQQVIPRDRQVVAIKNKTRGPSLLDRAVAHINPIKGLQREVARQKLDFLNSGYSHHGASTTKKSLKDWDSESNSPDEDINDNLSLLRADSYRKQPKKHFQNP